MKIQLRQLSLALVFVLAGASCKLEWFPEAEKPVTVILLRHAEDLDDGVARDPVLSEEGEERARVLLRLLSRSKLTHLFATQYRRTQGLLAPIAEAHDLDLEIIDASKTREQLAAVKNLPPGSIAVVAGHSNTVPAMVAALGGELEELTDRGHFDEDSYDRLVWLTLPVGEETLAQCIELRYGAESGG
ncbi:MAG: histidine phosphatase family protein [Planctomycetota bacterium]|jgi:broad specificity phosphatase PhoE